MRPPSPQSHDDLRVEMAWEACGQLGRRAGTSRATAAVAAVVLGTAAVLLGGLSLAGAPADDVTAGTVWLLCLEAVTVLTLLPLLLLTRAAEASEQGLRIWASHGPRSDDQGPPQGTPPMLASGSLGYTCDFLVSLLSPVTMAIAFFLLVGLAPRPLPWAFTSALTVSGLIVLVAWVWTLLLLQRSRTAPLEPMAPVPPRPARQHRRSDDEQAPRPEPSRAGAAIGRSQPGLIEQVAEETLRRALSETRRAQPAPAPSPEPPEIPAPAEPPPAPPTTEPAGPPMRQTMRRWTREDGSEVIEGTCRVCIAAGELRAIEHIGFCPSLPATPQVQCETADGDLVEITVASRAPYGARIDVHTEEPPDEDFHTEFVFRATCGSQGD